MTVIPLKSLPLGFRFHPTDEELVTHYLKGKITGRIHSEMEIIPEIDVCKCEPWDLPDKSLIRSDDHEWFYFAPIDRKYPNGHRSNRATGAGYWKATGKDRVIRSRTTQIPVVIGMKKTLVFHRGRAPKGLRTCWIMHEYRTTEPEFQCGEQGGYMLYRLFKKPEERGLNCIDDEMVNGGYSQTNSKCSPADLQLISDEIEDCSATLEQASTELGLCGEPLSQSLNETIKQQSPAKLKWFGEKVDSLRDSKGEQDGHFDALTTFDVANNNTEETVDPLINVLEQLYDPYDEQTVGRSFPNVASPIPYIDWPVYNIGYEPDHIDEVLNTMLARQDKYDGDDVRADCQAICRKEDSQGFARESVSSCEVYNSNLVSQQGGAYSGISEKLSEQDSLPHQEILSTGLHYGVLYNQTMLQQFSSGDADIFAMNSGATYLPADFTRPADIIRQETVTGNVDCSYLNGNNIRIGSVKQWPNHVTPAIQGLAKRRLRLPKKMYGADSNGNGDHIMKKEIKEMVESQLAIGKENVEKLKDFHGKAKLTLTQKLSCNSHENFKCSSFLPLDIWKAGTVIAYMRRLALLVIFALLLAFLWRSVALHVK